MKIGALILAAGLSSRMQAFKPLVELGGFSLLERCARLFWGAQVDDILVVTGHLGEQTAKEAKRLGLRSVQNAGYRDGMLSSVQTGVGALEPHLDGFFLLPVDIPLIRPATIAALHAAFAAVPDETLIPCFGRQTGHPPLIPADLIPEIADYRGQGGLQSLLACRSHRLLKVWDRGILLDADTPDDLAALRRHLERLSIPSRDEACALERLLVPAKVQKHGRLVAHAALAMACALAEHGLKFDCDLVYAGGLLHDLAKGQPEHGLRAAEVLTELGLAPVAAAVTDHCDLAPPADGRLTEAHLVCLADKAVSGTRLVDPGLRFLEKIERFRNRPEVVLQIQERRNRGLSLQRLFEEKTGCKLLELLRQACR